MIEPVEEHSTSHRQNFVFEGMIQYYINDYVRQIKADLTGRLRNVIEVHKLKLKRNTLAIGN